MPACSCELLGVWGTGFVGPDMPGSPAATACGRCPAPHMVVCRMARHSCIANSGRNPCLLLLNTRQLPGCCTSYPPPSSTHSLPPPLKLFLNVKPPRAPFSCHAHLAAASAHTHTYTYTHIHTHPGRNSHRMYCHTRIVFPVLCKHTLQAWGAPSYRALYCRLLRPYVGLATRGPWLSGWVGEQGGRQRGGRRGKQHGREEGGGQRGAVDG